MTQLLSIRNGHGGMTAESTDLRRSGPPTSVPVGFSVGRNGRAWAIFDVGGKLAAAFETEQEAEKVLREFVEGMSEAGKVKKKTRAA